MSRTASSEASISCTTGASSPELRDSRNFLALAVAPLPKWSLWLLNEGRVSGASMGVWALPGSLFKG